MGNNVPLSLCNSQAPAGASPAAAATRANRGTTFWWCQRGRGSQSKSIKKDEETSFILRVPHLGACGTRAWRSRGRSVRTKWRSATVTTLIEDSRPKIIKNTLSQATSSGPCARTARRTRSPAASTRGSVTIQQIQQLRRRRLRRRPQRRLRRHWPTPR